MLILDTPIQLGSQTYTHVVGGIRGEFDLRTRKLDITLALAREKTGKLIIATKEKDGETARLFSPPIIAILTLQDSSPADPALAGVFQKLHELVESIESVLVANGALANQVYQAGEDEVSLACTFVPSATPGEIEEKDKLPKPLK